MKSRAVHIGSAMAGPIVVLTGLAGMMGFGLPTPYSLTAVLVGAALILFGQRGLKKARPVSNAPADIHNDLLAQKRHRFWIFVALASSLYAVGAYWLPSTTPEMRRQLATGIMFLAFGLCVGIFIYSTYTSKRR